MNKQFHNESTIVLSGQSRAMKWFNDESKPKVQWFRNSKSMAAAQGTPESDTGSFECFRNYTAPEVFVQGLAGIVDQQDVESMIRAQKQM